MPHLDSVHCTNIETSSSTKSRRHCHNKYCKSCLRNRYNEDMAIIKANKPTDLTRITGETYDYKCVAT